VKPTLAYLALYLALQPAGLTATTADDLESGWANPPTEARLRAYWWWLNGNVTKEAITRDLQEMKAKGFGGALICDAGGADQEGNGRVPHGPTFLTPAWRELYKHTLREADRLGLEMSLNILSGWNLGGPEVKAEDAAKKLVWSESHAQGPGSATRRLPEPEHKDAYYKDLFVVAYRTKPVPTGSIASAHRPLRNWAEKALVRTMGASAPDTSSLLEDMAPEPGEEDTTSAEVIDLTAKLGADGALVWNAPEGDWKILRFGCTIGDHAHVSTSSEGWGGYAVDALDKNAFRRYWDAVVEPLIADAGPLAGRTLKYLHTDSWEVEAINWTPTLRTEFRKRRGYDLLPFIPVIAGDIVDSRPVSNRFLNDFRRTIGDLAADNHYGSFVALAHERGLLIHPESGGPHAVPIDAQQCLGADDLPMSEFWAWSWEHRIGDDNRFFVKQPASAAHTYGRRLALAEGFTSMGPHWQERICDNLKPSFDKALCEGLGLLVWHAFVCSPKEMGMPGQQYFAGTHFNPNTTWWQKSVPFLAYIDRCQFLLQQGRFVADACYYYGDQVPNFAQLKSSDPAKVLPGYDYDVIDAQALLSRMSVKAGRLVLPDGMNYRLLVLPNRAAISLPVLRKVQELVAEGATVIGPKQPTQTSGLEDFPRCDAEVSKLAAKLWEQPKLVADVRTAGNGPPHRVLSGCSARDFLEANGVMPDFEASGGLPDAAIDYIHRRAGATEVYFVANRSNRWETLRCTFRVAGLVPELWDPVSGSHHFAAAYEEKNGRTSVPLEFAPCGSIFVVFRDVAAKHPPTSQSNGSTWEPVSNIGGPWIVKFDPAWGGPASAQFDQLTSWNSRPEPGIKYYSGTATYTRTFDLPANVRSDAAHRLWLDLGDVRELAEVHLNGKNLGIIWTPPFRVDITEAARTSGNQLAVEVVNFWPNRIIGDQFLPPEKRFTRTNIRKLTRDTPLMDSGLLGPVRVLQSNP
jgi:hypothetical protein